jgi:hypothetical protein
LSTDTTHAWLIEKKTDMLTKLRSGERWRGPESVSRSESESSVRIIACCGSGEYSECISSRGLSRRRLRTAAGRDFADLS